MKIRREFVQYAMLFDCQQIHLRILLQAQHERLSDGKIIVNQCISNTPRTRSHTRTSHRNNIVSELIGNRSRFHCLVIDDSDIRTMH